MSKNLTQITMCCWILALAPFASAQSTRKPGLWEMTTNMTWQQSPMPTGMTMPAGAGSTFGGGPHTTQVCLTQAMINKYGAPMPQSRKGECEISNVVLKPDGMTADWVCSGSMSGKGTLKSSCINISQLETARNT